MATSMTQLLRKAAQSRMAGPSPAAGKIPLRGSATSRTVQEAATRRVSTTTARRTIP